MKRHQPLRGRSWGAHGSPLTREHPHPAHAGCAFCGPQVCAPWSLCRDCQGSHSRCPLGPLPCKPLWLHAEPLASTQGPIPPLLSTWKSPDTLDSTGTPELSCHTPLLCELISGGSPARHGVAGLQATGAHLAPGREWAQPLQDSLRPYMGASQWCSGMARGS